MKYLHKFDPWNFPLCTCPEKYSLDPYTGCEHRCIYCYITSYIKDPWRVRPKKDFLKYLERDLKHAPKMPVSMSNSSDPYPSMERELLLTRGTLELLKRYEFPVLLLTKSDLVTRDADILSSMKSVVSITITTLNEKLARKLEPLAPSPERRLRAIEELKDWNIWVAVRIDPIIPSINSDFDGLEKLVETLSSLNVDQIITSVYKAKPDNFKRVCSVFKKECEYLRNLYYGKGMIIRGNRYAPIKIRLQILSKLRDLATRYHIPFSVCREGLPLNTAKTCDASHLITEKP